MGLAIRLMMSTVAYLCVGTVVAALLGAGYLWQSGTLTNEKMFQVSAILHDVDLERLVAEQESGDDEVPPEEPSLEDLRGQRAVLVRDYEMKSEQLRRQTSEFKHMWELLATEMDRRDKVAKALDARLAQAEADVISEGNAGVARHLNQMKPQQVKDEFLKMIDANEMEQLIPLMEKMTDTQLKKVLQQFKSESDIATLDKIHRLMRKGFPKKDIIDQTRQEMMDLQADSP